MSVATLGWFIYGERKLVIDHMAVDGQNMVADIDRPSNAMGRGGKPGADLHPRGAGKVILGKLERVPKSQNR